VFEPAPSVTPKQRGQEASREFAKATASAGARRFDILAAGGDDYRRLPLSLRRPTWRGYWCGGVDGIHLAPFEQGEIGPDLFRHACLMGLEGLVSKHRDSPYRAGRSPRWIKGKNRAHPAFARVLDQFG
jgi:bifunctional non-homologous end joining protein LigD